MRITGHGPLCGLNTGGPKDPFPQGDYEAGTLGQRDELGWQHEPEFRVLPPQQRLYTHDPGGLQIPFGLVVQQKFMFLKPLLQAIFKRDAVHDPRVHSGGEKLVLTLPLLLRLVHGRICAFHQAFHI